MVLVPAMDPSRLSTSSGVLTERAWRVGTVRFAMPVSTPPGPHSTRVVTPASARAMRHWRHRTGLHSCAESRLAQSSPWWCASASTLEITGTSVSRGFALAIALRNRSRAGAMKGVWNAPLTGSGSTFFAPSSLAFAAADATPSGDPAITTCPGALKFATHTSLSARRHAISTSSSSSPRTAAIVPG